jgi:signal transduction histidine kinase
MDADGADSNGSDSILAAAFETTATGFLIFDRNGMLVRQNPAALALLPFLASDPGSPKRFSEITVAFPILAILGDRHADVRMGTRWLRARRRGIRDGGTVYELTDITDLKQSEGTLVNARDMALLADRAKSEFLANMTHELRTPLNAIIGFAEVLRDELLGPLGNPAYKDFIADIHSSGTHLLAIINDILDLSKIEVGHRAPHREIMDVAATIASSVRMLSRRANDAGVTLDIVTDNNLPLLLGEERSVKQIVLNLLSNGIKFTDPGGRITVTASRNGKGGLDLSVADTGIGIAPEDQKRVFTPFVQIETGRASQSNGAGLGLSLVKSLAEMHDATVNLDSTPGQGTTVTIHFPASALSERPPKKKT